MSDDGQTVAFITNLGQTANPRGRPYLYTGPKVSTRRRTSSGPIPSPSATSDVASAPDGQHIAVTLPSKNNDILKCVKAILLP